jgi:hypothetical protein
MVSSLDCCAKVPSQRVPEGCIGAKVTGALEGNIGASIAWGAGGLIKEVLRAFRADCLSTGVFCTDECTGAVASPWPPGLLAVVSDAFLALLVSWASFCCADVSLRATQAGIIHLPSNTKLVGVRI